MKSFLTVLITAFLTLTISGCVTATTTCKKNKDGTESCTSTARPW